MAKAGPVHRCAECGWTTPRWVGRCGGCQAWGTIEATVPAAGGSTAAGPVTTAAVPIDRVDAQPAYARGTGVAEFDRVLGGGLVPGAVVLLAGEPGVGKSTLLLDVAARVAEPGRAALYVTGEESAAQVRLRAGRIDALNPEVLLAAETDLAAVLGQVDEVRPALLIVDSVQTIASRDVDGGPGGVSQVREVAGQLIRVAKQRGIAVILVGHVTKDGSVAGPRLLEHLVDVVLHFEGDRHARLRLVRAVKNRYGNTDEVGCFELLDDGIHGLADPSRLFLSQRDSAVPGTCVTVTVEGRRPLVAEVQTLAVDGNGGTPRRATAGVDPARVAMLCAVLERHAGLPLSHRELYVATVGGMRVAEPAADLAVALALNSGVTDHGLSGSLVAIGEVGLAGDVRRVVGVDRRLQEAARLGFSHALVPPDSGPAPAGIVAHEVSQLRQALRLARDIGGGAVVTPLHARR
ncbi:MAG: DNA repair protein RadA [Actinomycetota bacterium]|nr:MAG: DNA repair protein RadA [Actinomycetota bacterium]